VKILETARDISIIVLAGLALLAFFLFFWLISSIISFLRTIREDLRPILKAGEETLKTATGVFKLVTDSLGEPLGGFLKKGRRGTMVLRFVSRFLKRRKKK
jgi:hypothetical protein